MSERSFLVSSGPDPIALRVPSRTRRVSRMSCGLVACVLAIGVTASTDSLAQEDARKVQSTPIFEEGLKLADRGKNEEALVKFRQSYDLYPSPNTLFNIARTEHLLGKRAEAYRDYSLAIKNPILNPQMAARGKKFVAELDKVVGHVEVAGPAGTKVFVNDVEYTLPLAAPIAVEAGPVIAKAQIDGVSVEKGAQVAPGTTSKLDLSPPEPTLATTEPAPAPKPASALIEPPAEPREEASFWGWRSITGLSLVGVGAVALGAGFVFSADESSAQDRVDTLGRSLGPSNAGCAGNASAACAQLKQARDDRNAASDRASIAFIGGGVAAGVGAAFIVSALIAPHKRSSSSSAQVVPVMGPSQAGLVFRTGF